MAQQGGYGIEEIYRGVIGDVVNQVREAFLDEGVDIELLQQLKRSWESKIQASGAVDLENRQPLPLPAPLQTIKQQRQQPAQNTPLPSQPLPIPENIPGPSSSLDQLQGQGIHQQNAQAIINTQNHVQLLGLPSQMLASGALQLPAGIMPGTQYAIVEGPNGAPSLVLLNPQMQLNLESQAQFLLQQQNAGGFRRSGPEVATKKEPGSHVPQLDGGGSSQFGNNDDVRMGKGRSEVVTKGKSTSRHLGRKKISQLDGGGPGMMDSSSEEEHEDDDPLNRYVGLEDEGGEKGEPEEDEEPLNSGDDQSDDEDLDTLFDADNVVVCQFEKVHRARNKWKFILKDGVMQIKGKDYCFHKSTGEAEW